MKKTNKQPPLVDLSDLLDEPPAGPAVAGDKLASFESEIIGPPIGTILFWAEYTCACGHKFNGPMLDSPVLVKHELKKHVCFGHYRHNGYIYRPATTETQFLEAEVHWEQKSIPKCIMCAHKIVLPDMRQIEDPAKRDLQMHECADPNEYRKREERRLHASLHEKKEQDELTKWYKEQL